MIFCYPRAVNGIEIREGPLALYRAAQTGHPSPIVLCHNAPKPAATAAAAAAADHPCWLLVGGPEEGGFTKPGGRWPGLQCRSPFGCRVGFLPFGRVGRFRHRRIYASAFPFCCLFQNEPISHLQYFEMSARYSSLLRHDSVGPRVSRYPD